MNRRNCRVVLRWIFVLSAFTGLAIACAPAPPADMKGHDGGYVIASCVNVP